MQRAAGLEAIRMRGNPAHSMQRDWTATHCVVASTSPIGPRHRELDFLLKRGMRYFRRKPPNGFRRDPATFRDRFGRVARIEITFGHKLKDGDGATTVRQRRISDKTSYNTCRRPTRQRSRGLKDKRIAGFVAGKEPVIRGS